MTKFKYDNRGGSGFYTFFPYNQTKTSDIYKKKDKKIGKTELLTKDIKQGKKLRNSKWNSDDLSYKEIKLGLAIKILLKIVMIESEIYPTLNKMKKDNVLYSRMMIKIKSNYKNISTAALKITLEENISSNK